MDERGYRYKYHDGEVRRIGWLIGDKFGFAGMVEAFYIFREICNHPSFFTGGFQKFNPSSALHGYDMGRLHSRVEHAWNGVHGWNTPDTWTEFD